MGGLNRNFLAPHAQTILYRAFLVGGGPKGPWRGRGVVGVMRVYRVTRARI